MTNDSGQNKNLNTNITAIKGDYFERTARPIYAMLFLMPFIIVYEILVLVVNPQLLNTSGTNAKGVVVAFVWVQNFLQFLGMRPTSAWLAAPLTVVLTLLAMQITSRKSWKVRLPDFVIMTAECVALATPLIVLALVLNRAPKPQQQNQLPANCITVCQQELQNTAGRDKEQKIIRRSIAMDMLTGIGAGIYEELIFRLFLIGVSMMFLEVVLGISKTKAVCISVLLSAVLFSLHHHFVFLDGRLDSREIFTAARFTFRAIAGVFFAVIFAVRGFGVAAGTHAFYDIIATFLNAWAFGQY